MVETITNMPAPEGGKNQNNGERSQEARQGRTRSKVIRSIETRINERRSFGEKLSDDVVRVFGNFRFALFNLFFFAAWLAVNTGFIPAIPVFDPYPFVLLITIVSLEAIFLSTFLLISQNRESRISDLREEFDLQVTMIAEQEITKVIHLVSYIIKHLNVPYERDPELKRMMKPLDTDEIQRELERQLNLPPEKPPPKPPQ